MNVVNHGVNQMNVVRWKDVVCIVRGIFWVYSTIEMCVCVCVCAMSIYTCKTQCSYLVLLRPTTIASQGQS